VTDLGYEPAGSPPKPPQPVIHGPDPTHMGHVEKGQWEQVAETEARVRKEFSGDIDRLTRVINTAQRVLAIKNAPGYQQFEQSVIDLRQYAQTEMVGCKDGNDQIRILQGRCQAFSSILALMRNTEHNIKNLSQQLEMVREKADRAVGPNGKIRPETIGDM
jgi:hypothetical protein